MRFPIPVNKCVKLNAFIPNKNEVARQDNLVFKI